MTSLPSSPVFISIGIGRVPLFYYLLHIPLIHLSGLLVNFIKNGFVAGPIRRKAGSGIYNQLYDLFMKFSHSIGRFIMGLKRPSKTANLRRLREWGETLESFTIREATVNDLPALAALHVQTWSDTYWTVKNPPTYEIREHQWREQFAVKDGSWFCFVVQNREGRLIGFAKGARYSHADLPDFGGELNQLYMLLEYQRLGLGRLMVGHVARRFLSMGITSMVLFGIPQNPSNRFHEALRGERLYDKKGDFHGGYGWRDLQKLAEICPVD